MHNVQTRFTELSDQELIDRVGAMAAVERRATVELIAALAELERRKLYLPQGCSSLFVYCTRVLHLSEHAAYNRIEAARASSLFPSILDGLADGSLTLAAVRLLAPILTPDNHERLLLAATHRSKRDIELLVAGERPRPDAPTQIRRLPAPTTPAKAPSSMPAGMPGTPPAATLAIAAAKPAQANPRPVCEPLTPERYKIQFTASRDFHDKLRRAQALLRHAVPNGDPAVIFERALDLLVAAWEKQKLGATNNPRAAGAGVSPSRYIPAAVKREVWKRDGGRCAFAGTAGRCSEVAFLEFHHVVPFALGGAATTANIELRCRAHNAYEADTVFKPMLGGCDPQAWSVGVGRRDLPRARFSERYSWPDSRPPDRPSS